jgi:hypothetical protein
MAQKIFINPNDPEQPQPGVYRWYFLLNEKKTTIYIGNAGDKEYNIPNDVYPHGTLLRGVSEAQRNCFAQENGNKLDTDFIVGTILKYIVSKNYNCYWEHIDNNPKNENIKCNDLSPLIQTANNTILNDFYCRNISNMWKIIKKDKEKNRQTYINAEREIFSIFEKILKSKSIIL